MAQIITSATTSLAAIRGSSKSKSTEKADLNDLLEIIEQVRTTQGDVEKLIMGLTGNVLRIEQKVDRIGPSDGDRAGSISTCASEPFRSRISAMRSSVHLDAVGSSSRSQGTSGPSTHSHLAGDTAVAVPRPEHYALSSGWPASTKPRSGLIFSQKRSRRALFGRGPTSDSRDGASSDPSRTLEFPARTWARSASSVEEGESVAVDTPKWSNCWRLGALDPNSSTRVIYDFVALFIVMWDLTATPFTVAWDVPFQGFLWYWAWMSLLFWAGDVLVTFATGIYKDGELELDLGAIAKAYLKGYFSLDVTLSLVQGVSLLWDGSKDAFRAVLFMRILRLTRMLRILRLLRTVKAFFWRPRSHNVTIALHCLGLATGILWLAHVLACMWYAIGRLAPSDTGHRWVDQLEVDGDVRDPMYQYATAYHFSLQQLAAGSMDMRPTNSWERQFNILCLLFGWLGGSSIVASLSTIMIEAQSHWKERSKKLRILQLFLEQNGVQHQFSIRVQNQVMNKVDKDKRISEERVHYLALLSPMLKAELYEQMYGPHGMRLPIFRIWNFVDSSAFRNLCAKAMQMSTFHPTEVIFNPGETTDCCFVLISGGLKYMQHPDTSIVSDMETTAIEDAGQVLAEASLWCQWAHVGTCEATTEAAVLVIDGTVFAQVCNQSKASQDFTLEYGRIFYERLTQASFPRSAWPSDIKVPATQFEDIVMDMDFGWRRLASFCALKSFESTWTSGDLFRPRKGLEQLQEEVNRGKCTLIQEGSGEIVRMVAVTVLKLSREDGQTWTQVAKFEDGALNIDVKLPGSKLVKGEAMSDALDNMLYKVLKPLVDGVEVQSVEHQHTSGNSGAFGINTKYIRMIHSASLTEDFKIEPDAATCRIVRLDPFKFAYIIKDDENRDLVYSWLTGEEFVRFTSSSLEAREELLELLLPISPDREGWANEDSQEPSGPLIRRSISL